MKKVDYSETIAACDLKLIDYMKMIVRLSLLRKAILNPEYDLFMCVCVFVDACISQF